MQELLELIGQFNRLFGITSIEFIVYAMAVIFLIAIGIAIAQGYFKIILDIAYFAYPAARVKAIGNPYIRPDKVRELLESKSASEVMDKITELEHKIGASGDVDVDKIERSLNVTYLQECEKIVHTAPEGVKPFFRAYLMMLEAEQLKIAIRAKKVGLPPEEIEKKLISTGNVTSALIKRMADADGMEDLVMILQNTPYGRPLSDALLEYAKMTSVLSLELALDKFVFQQLHNSKQHVDVGMVDPIKKFIGVYVDITNIKMVLRAKKDEVEAETMQKYILSGGLELSEASLKQISEYKNVMEIVTQFEETVYMSSLEKVIPEYEATKSIYPFEVALDKFLLNSVSFLATVYHLGVGPLIKFIVAKQYEVRNIGAAIRGAHEGVSLEKMKKIVVCEESI